MGFHAPVEAHLGFERPCPIVNSGLKVGVSTIIATRRLNKIVTCPEIESPAIGLEIPQSNQYSV